ASSRAGASASWCASRISSSSSPKAAPAPPPDLSGHAAAAAALPAVSRQRTQRGEEDRQLDAVLAAGLLHRVEAADRAADAMHAVVEEGADGRRPAAHHLVHIVARLDGHGVVPGCVPPHCVAKSTTAMATEAATAASVAPPRRAPMRWSARAKMTMRGAATVRPIWASLMRCSPRFLDATAAIMPRRARPVFVPAQRAGERRASTNHPDGGT